MALNNKLGLTSSAELAREEERMPQSTYDEIVEKYVEMNIAHPFREGNGRSTRIWLDQMFKAGIGRVVDWSRVDKEDYLLAMEQSPIRGIEIKFLLKEALTDDVDSRDVTGTRNEEDAPPRRSTAVRHSLSLPPAS